MAASPLPAPLPLIEATLAFTVQVFLARHPELLLPPEVPVLHPPPSLRAARHVVAAIRELFYAIETSRSLLPNPPPRGTAPLAGEDEFPF
jgi:hypothetical protein